MSTTRTKSARVDFRLATQEKETLEKAATLSGLNLSDFIVHSSLSRASEVLQQQTRVVLSERDWRAFLDALEEDREPTEAARSAALRYNEGRREGGRYEWKSSR